MLINPKPQGIPWYRVAEICKSSQNGLLAFSLVYLVVSQVASAACNMPIYCLAAAQ